MRFTKMHGLGNDYVYVNAFDEDVPEPCAVARAVSDRNFGIGSDGLILVMPPEPGVEADARMRMFNADGSEAEMCGNGIRCVAKLVHDRGISTRNPLRIQTRRGVLSLDYTLGPANAVDTVTVDMGEPILSPAEVPVSLPGERVVDQPLPDEALREAGYDKAWFEAHGILPRATCVSMGNPHLILYCDDLTAVPLSELGPALEHLSLFPARVNVHFVKLQGRKEATVLHWERGSGATLACGTGACAVCVAGVLTALTDRRLLTHLPGGDLILHWREQDNHVFMTGPAVEVFTGEWPQSAT